MGPLERVEAIGVLFLIAFALGTAVPWSYSPAAHAAAAPAQSQTLTPFTGTLCRPYTPPPFSIDLGSINYCFSQNKVSWQDNWTPVNNFTFNIPKVSGTSFGITTSQNSSAIDYHLTATVLGRTVTADVFFVQRGYNYKIAIIGTISGTAITFPLAVPFGNTNSVCDTGSTCLSVFQGHLGMDWSDAKGFSPSYNNVTKTLTFTIGNSFSIDPIAIDTSGSCSHAGATNTCTTGSITTGARNDLILMFQYSKSNGPPDCEAQTMTSSPAMTWRERNNVAQGTGEFCEYYAQWDSAGAFTATCNGAANGVGGCFIVAISDAMIKPPSFDTGLCINGRVVTTTTTTTISACPVTSYNQRDLLIGAIAASAATPTITAGAGFTLIGCIQANALSVCAENQFVSSTQTNTQVKWVDVTASGSNVAFLSDTVEEFKPDMVQFATCNVSIGGNCHFTKKMAAGDSILAMVAFDSNTRTVTGITDNDSLTYSFIVSKTIAVAGDVEGWWSCNSAPSKGTTVTPTVGGSGGTAEIITLYELTPSDSSCTVRSSTGTGSGTGNPSVSSYTPINASFVIGAWNCATTSGPTCGVTQANGYSITDGGGAYTAQNILEPLHATNNGTSETSNAFAALTGTGITWNEISMSFVRPTPNALITTTTSTTTTTTSPTTTTSTLTTTGATTTTTSFKCTNCGEAPNYSWLLVFPFILIILVLLVRRRR